MDSDAGQTKRLAWVLAIGLIVRVLLDLYLAKAGYYYGEDPDSFWRLGLAWRWSQEPFFGTFHWVPLQFILEGLTFKLLRPLGLGANMLVPVLWNHAFFLVSLAFATLTAKRIGGWWAGLAAAVLAITLTEDIWTTYSSLSEPLTVACAMAVGYCLYMYFDVDSRRRQRYVVGAGLAAGIASANHYVGWALVPVAAGLAVLHVAKPPSPRPNAFQVRYLPAASALLGSAGFPLAWLWVNYQSHGSPLYFLRNARTYHPWVAKIPLAGRLAAVPHALFSAAPFLVLAAGAAIVVAWLVNRSALVLLVPVAAYLLLLTISSLRAWGVPDMHTRYALVPLWLIVSLVGYGASKLLRSRDHLARLAAAGMILVPAVSGLADVPHFENAIGPEARAVTLLLESWMSSREVGPRILVESEACLHPVGAIANGVSSPESIELLPSADLLQLVSSSPQALSAFDLLVLTNPMTAAKLTDDVSVIDRIGDYRVSVPSAGQGANGRSAGIPEHWQLINAQAFHLVDNDGTIYFGFDPAPASLGDTAGLKASLDVAPSGCRILHAEVQDRYGSDDHPWAAVQQLVVNGLVLWSHDIAAENHCGWRPVDVYLMPTTSHLDIQLRVAALTGPELPVDWRQLSLTGVRGLTLTGCP